MRETTEPAVAYAKIYAAPPRSRFVKYRPGWLQEATDGVSIVPELSVRRGREAVEFYKQAFGAVEVYRVGGTDDSPDVVSQLAVGKASFWVSDEAPAHANFSPETIGGGTVRMLLVVDDPEQAVARAKAAGATEVYPVTDAHGWRLGRIEDPFGHHWEIGKPFDPVAASRRLPGTH